MGWLDRFGSKPKVRHVAPRDAHEVIQAGGQLLDVRNRSETRALRPANAKQIPLSVLPRQVKQLDPDKPVVCICASGARSAAAARHLAKEGFESYNVRGGVGAWQRAGLPTESG